MCMPCVCEWVPLFARDLKLIEHAWTRPIWFSLLQMMSHFAAQILHWNAQELVIGTCRTTYIEDSAVGAAIHSYCGAKLMNLFNIVNQYPPHNFRSVCIVAGFKDHHYSRSHFTECYRILLDIICYKFQRLVDVAHKVIATSNSKLVNGNNTNWTWLCIVFFNLYSSFNHFTIFFFSKSAFFREGFHFSFYGSHLFAFYLHSVISFCNVLYA